MIKKKRVEHDLSIKNFVISVGRSIIDISAFVCIISIVIGGLITGEYAILVIPIGLIVMVVIYYLLYLAIDIRDNLVKLNETVEELNEGLLEEETEIKNEPQKIS